jgi:hypothetical protein
VANLPSTFKPIVSTGAARLLVISVAYAVSASNAFAEVILDSTSVLATRAYTDGKVNDLAATVATNLANAIAGLPTVAADSDKLGGQSPSYYAPQSALNTTNSTVSTLSSTVSSNQTAALAAVAAAMPTGAEMAFWGTVAPSGFVLASGRTIGNASSGATERANADTEPLFTLLWNATAQTELAIQTSSGGASTRGASAAADYAANKRMPLPDMRGRVGVGLDNMGGTTASRVTVAGTGVDGTVAGKSGGAETHTLTIAQMPAHTHTIPSNSSRNTTAGGSDNVGMSGQPSTITSSSQGSGTAHNNMQPFIVRNVLIKL